MVIFRPAIDRLDPVVLVTRGKCTEVLEGSPDALV